jgi:cell division transport system ATP-binding protein
LTSSRRFTTGPILAWTFRAFRVRAHVADEPTGHVGDETASLLVRVFERVNQLGTTVLVATRDIGFTRRFEHPRLHLDRGALHSIEAVAQ